MAEVVHRREVKYDFPHLIHYLVYIIFFIVEALLLIRVVLKLFGANVGNGFVQWLYNTTEPLISPFAGIFPSPHIDGGAYIIEFSTLFAMIIYALIGYLIVEAVHELLERNVRRRHPIDYE